ncbi:MAG: 2-oxoglutarate dehydrogenase E1 component, partial [Syntrophobacteraceae bacterium]|nr:2-oxoglutarate dehydrogenase E1 component [Syntrophobacteraceae bacterium]
RIKERPSVFTLYAERLQEEGLVTREELDLLQQGSSHCLDMAYQAAREKTCRAPSTRFYEDWQDLHATATQEPSETGVSDNRLRGLAAKLNTRPEGFKIHPRLGRILDRRLEAVERGEGIDWATAEALAFGSLLMEGTPIRFTGQDCRRGTFSQRHAVLVDVETGENFTPLNALDAEQASLSIHDSLLAESSVLGFEYGYSLVSPGALVIWEAQFGDFSNNAQSVIDQYIACGEAKWGRQSGLVLLLPHGMEGQGPEHSSARPERFLQLCAEENIQVCNPSTPAQVFHVLRRQVRRSFRKPLVVMAPKSLLRNPLAVSRRADMASGSFQEVLDDAEATEKAERILFCSGKIFYDLVEKRRQSGAGSSAIIRLEQLYPFPGEQVTRVLSRYSRGRSFVWVQEEPENMGAWQFVQPFLRSILQKDVGYVGRPASASPASGYHQIHKTEQEAILGQALEQ